jgi:hypothetical protein
MNKGRTKPFPIIIQIDFSFDELIKKSLHTPSVKPVKTDPNKHGGHKSS